MGGVLNLSLGSSMTTEECLGIIQKLDNVSKNKFYTVNVYDTKSNTYLGDSELVVEADGYRIMHSIIKTDVIRYYVYTFNKSGKYSRTMKGASLSDILSRLDVIEDKLNNILLDK